MSGRFIWEITGLIRKFLKNFAKILQSFSKKAFIGRFLSQMIVLDAENLILETIIQSYLANSQMEFDPNFKDAAR